MIYISKLHTFISTKLKVSIMLCVDAIPLGTPTSILSTTDSGSDATQRPTTTVFKEGYLRMVPGLQLGQDSLACRAG
jgi:hypothetical protein